MFMSCSCLPLSFHSLRNGRRKASLLRSPNLGALRDFSPSGWEEDFPKERIIDRNRLLMKQIRLVNMYCTLLHRSFNPWWIRTSRYAWDWIQPSAHYWGWDDIRQNLTFRLDVLVKHVVARSGPSCIRGIVWLWLKVINRPQKRKALALAAKLFSSNPWIRTAYVKIKSRRDRCLIFWKFYNNKL